VSKSQITLDKSLIVFCCQVWVHSNQCTYLRIEVERVEVEHIDHMI
jgi:hypothetical protein